MRTQTAKVFNRVTNTTEKMSAVEFETRYIGNERLGTNPTQFIDMNDLEITNPENDEPLTFRPSHYSDGREKFIRACWVRQKGSGDEHFYDRTAEPMKDAIKSGKSVLLTLNLKLCNSGVSFENMRGHCVLPNDVWKEKNRGSYITASVNSVEDTVKMIKRIQTLTGQAGMSIKDRIFATHRGGVIPYWNFFIGSRNKIVSLYNDMQDGKGGVYSNDKTIINGFPRLMSFIPTGTTVKQEDIYRLKGNHAKGAPGEGKPYLTQLTFEKEDDKRNTPEYQQLKEGIIGSQAAYVLASPRVYLSSGAIDWKYLFLDIKNISAQALVLDPETKEKLLRYRECEEKKWGTVLAKDTDDPSKKKEEIIFKGNRPNEHYL